MKKLLFTVAFIFASMNLYSAGSYSFLAKEGDQAVQFGVNNFALDNLGGGFGYQYYFVNNVALRARVGGYFSNASLPKEKISDFQDYSKNMYGLYANLGMRFNFLARNSVVFYSGGEITFGMDVTKETGKNFLDVSTSTTSFRNSAGLFLGAEWFITSNVSLSAEYVFNATLKKSTSLIESSTQSIETKQPTVLDINFGKTQGQIVLSFYL